MDTQGDDVEKSDKAAWDKDQAAVAKFVKEMKVPYPVLVDGDSISSAYGGLDDLPTSFFVDRSGKVVVATVGLDVRERRRGEHQEGTERVISGQ